MQSSSPWLRDFTAALESKPRHGSQPSISDDSHHVTEAIGDMYGEVDDSTTTSPTIGHTSRPLSYISAPHNDILNAMRRSPDDTAAGSTSPYPSLESPLSRRMSRDRPPPSTNGSGRMGSSGRSHSYGDKGGPLSPSRSLRETSPLETANVHFPLHDVDYESSPAAVAQEMVNLQALRRMSMVDNAAGDPDLPSYAPIIPPNAPTGADDEEDASRLFWVPARLHPELAPKEFKTFLETRVDQIKRRSGDEEMLSPDGMKRKDSGGLRRKKSMLSRQIDNAGGKAAENYRDGAENLARKRTSRQGEGLKVSDFEQLDIPEDATSLLRQLSLNSNGSSTGEDHAASDDMAILTSIPPSNSLKRSTRTTYRKGSLRRGERVPPSRRAGRTSELESEGISSPGGAVGDTDNSLARIQTEPSSIVEDHPANFSRPSLLNRARGATGNASPDSTMQSVGPTRGESDTVTRNSSLQGTFAERAAAERALSANSRSTAPSRRPTPEPAMVPRINIEIAPTIEDDDARATTPTYPLQAHIPERVSSHEPPPSRPPTGPLPPGPPRGIRPARAASSTPGSGGLIRQAQNSGRNGSPTLDDIVGHPSPLPGSSTRTDSLSFIPTFGDDRKDKKVKTHKDKDAHHDNTSKKSGWGWLLGNEEKERSKDREHESAGSTKKGKAKSAKTLANDNTRLDLLQTSIDGGRGRESLVLDRESIKLEEERRKESNRKGAGEGKKEKETGLFSSFFGGGKRKGEREGERRRDRFPRGLSPEPPHRALRADVDYNWTRFSILEERAIYRMAHIKLANPRRALYSQVLLSNFMYSYLAKVQEMHPPIQVAQVAAKGGQVASSGAQATGGTGSASPSQRHQSTPVASRGGNGGNVGHADSDRGQPQLQHRADSPYYQYHDQPAADPHAPSTSPSSSVSYVDDSQIYNYDHPHQSDSKEPSRSPARVSSQRGNDHGRGDSAHTGNTDIGGAYDYDFDEHGQKIPLSRGGKLDHDGEEDEMW